MGERLLLHLTAILILPVAGRIMAQDLAQPPDSRIETAVQSLDVENGLPQGYVNGIVQDSTGFIWLGTRDGLARYDGYQVKTFHYDPGDSATIASDVIQTIYPDREDQIWILYENASVDVFDPITERVRHIRADGPLGWLLEGREYQRPFSLQQDSRGKYWVVSSDMKRLRYFTMQRPRPVDVPVPEEERIVAFREGRDGAMYVCTSHSFYKVAGDRLHKISDLPARRSARNDRISQMMQDDRGSWVILNNGYLDIFRPGGDWQTVSIPGRTDHTPFFFMDRSAAGELYITCAKYVFRLDTGYSLSRVWVNPNNPGDIPAMMIDRSDVLWLGTNTFGARLIHLSSRGFHSYVYDKGFVQDVLTQWFHVPPGEKYARAMDPYLLRYACGPKGGSWLLGTPYISGSPAARAPRLLLRMTGKEPVSVALQTDSLQWLQFAFDDHHDCWAIVPGGQQDTLLVKTGLGAGAAGLVTSWRPAFEDIGYLVASRDKLCIVYKKGVELFDPVSGKSVYYTSEDFFGDVQLLMAVPDPLDPAVLWITSLGYGLIRFDTGNGTVRAFTVKDGIPSNSVYAAVPDEKGRLWCSSNKGIFRFNPASHKVLSFVAKDGLQGNEFNRYHFLRSPGGHIIFGGTRGWTVFHPDSISVNTYQPETAITDILVNNVPLPEIPAWKGRAVTALSGLSLAYDQNFITFKFAGLQFSNSGKLQYRYQLEGVDKDWVEVGNRHIAGYTGLSDGEYLFKVNSSNGAGIWSSHVKIFPLTIRPPWWRTWWARCLYASVLLGLGYVLYRYRAARRRIRWQMIQQREEARQLRAMDEMKTRFFSNITHEFRTPLSLVIAPLEQINRDAEIPLSVRRKTARIQGSAEHLLRLINQLLDMSKIEAGNMKVSLSRGDLGLFIADHLKGFEAQVTQKDIWLDFENNLKGEYYFDADKWQKILFNLLSNAIKFTPEEGRIRVSLNAGSIHELQAVELRVKDSGIGIPAGKLPFIFDRFYQADDSATRNHGGTGIGLALVKELTELMKGTIEVKSEPGKGTLFRIFIPVETVSDRPVSDIDPVPSPDLISAPGSVSVSVPAPVPVSAPGPVSIPGSASAEQIDFSGAGDTAGKQGLSAGKTAPLILLVEDNKDLNDFVTESLGKKYRVISACNGSEALQKVKESPPDLVISDVMMPEMDGYALCKELKGDAATDHIGLILLSAKASHGSIIKGLENHADDYITKPFHIDELLLRVDNLLQRQQKLRCYYHRQLTVPGEQLDAQTITTPFLKRLYSVIEECLDETQLDVGRLAEKMAVSRRTLNRKLSVLVNLSASEVIRQYRLKRAVALLHSGLNVSETAYRVGFTSVSYFSNSFKDFYGVVPSAYLI